MNIKAKARLHNKFEIDVRDAKTGELKQKAYAFNVILNGYFTRMLSGNVRCVAQHIGVGSGSGTPAITDGGLFHEELTKGASSTVYYAFPTSRRVLTMKIESTECNGKTLTEVALGNWDSPSAYGCWLTHAMIQDSEGEPISIVKTNVDVVYITATFYCTVTNSGFGTNGIFPTDANIGIAKWALQMQGFGNLYASSRSMSHSDELSTKYTMTKSLNGITADTTNLKCKLNEVTVLDTEWNGSTVRTIGVPDIGAFSLPDNTAFPDYDVDHTAIGTGDGTTTEFSIKCPHIKSGTPRVFVNAAELSASDFTADVENNCNDAYENYYTADLEATGTSTQVVFGNFNDLTGTSTIYDPFAFGYRDGWKKTNKPASAAISSTNPIWIDFGTAKECNRLKITRNSPPAMTIEYSDDNETWNQVSATVSSNVYSFTKTTARYWKIYPTSGTWNASLTGYATLDSVSTGAYIFLGKTTPGLVLNSAPAQNAVIQASYKLTEPYKTSNNLIRFTCTIQFQRG